jgi:hypothetical protein
MAKRFEPFTIRKHYGSKSGHDLADVHVSAKDGVANDFHFVHLGKFAGAGLVTVEAAAVEPRGKIKGESL